MCLVSVVFCLLFTTEIQRIHARGQTTRSKRENFKKSNGHKDELKYKIDGYVE